MVFVFFFPVCRPKGVLDVVLAEVDDMNCSNGGFLQFNRAKLESVHFIGQQWHHSAHLILQQDLDDHCVGDGLDIEHHGLLLVLALDLDRLGQGAGSLRLDSHLQIQLGAGLDNRLARRDIHVPAGGVDGARIIMDSNLEWNVVVIDKSDSLLATMTRNQVRKGNVRSIQ